MATPKIKQLTTWSYSRYRDHKRCPFFAKCKHIDKLPEPSSPAMARGSDIGKKAEQYILGKLKKLPAELSLFKHEFEAVRALKLRNVFVEEQWTLDSAWRPIEHRFPTTSTGDLKWDVFQNSDWTAWRSIWIRIKMDLCGIDADTNVLVPVDHKTGRYRPHDLESYLEQLEIYSLGGMCKFPDVVGAAPKLWFLDEGLIYPGDDDEPVYYSRAELPALKKKWERKVMPMFNDTTFKATPNNKCMYCPFSKSHGGPCRF